MTKRKNSSLPTIAPLGPEFAGAEYLALENRARARQEFSQLVRDLIPVAERQAKKGRSRLLAVIGKILGEHDLDERSTTIINRIIATYEREQGRATPAKTNTPAKK